MRQFAFYLPELDVIILQTIMNECACSFEWDWFDLAMLKSKQDELYVQDYVMIYLGEL